MTSNFPASTSNSRIAPLFSLSDEERVNLIHETTPQKLIEIFSDLVNLPNQSNLDSLEAIVLHRIDELKEQLDPAQIFTIGRLCAEHLSYETQTTETSLKKEVELFFNSLTIDEGNLSSIMRYAYKNKSEVLLKKALAFIQSKTNIPISCENFGPISIDIRVSPIPIEVGGSDDYDNPNELIDESSDCDSYDHFESNNIADSKDYDNLNELTKFFLIITEAVDRNNVHIHFTPTKVLSDDFLKSFTKTMSDCIKTLNLEDKHPHYINTETIKQVLANCPDIQLLSITSDQINDDALNSILTNYPNLRYLSISSNKITENGFRDLGGLASLQKLKLHCPRLKALTIPDTLTSLHTFYLNSYRLEMLNIPDTLTSLQTLKLTSCELLATLILPRELTSLHELQIRDCRAFASLTLPNSITSIHTLKLRGCQAFASLTLPNSLTSIHTLEFRECHAFASLTLPNSLTSIHTLEFRECHAFASLTLPNSLTSIHTIKIFGCNIFTSLILPIALNSLNTLNLQSCYAFSELTLPNSLTELETLEISGSITLGTLTIPDTITRFHTLNLTSCFALHTLNLPNRLTSLNTLNLDHCDALLALNLPDTLTSLHILNFRHSRALTTLILSNALNTIHTLNLTYAKALTTLILPNTLKTIHRLYLTDCNSLKRLPLPETLILPKSFSIASLQLDFTKDLILLASSHPALFREMTIHSEIKTYSPILNILKMDENSEEPLTEKIRILKAFFNANEKLIPLLSYLEDIESKHPAEQLPLLRFIAYTAGLMLTLPVEQAARFLSPITNTSGPSSSNQPVSHEETLLHLIYHHKFAPHRYAFINQVVHIAETNPDYFVHNVLKWQNNWTKLASLTLSYAENDGDKILNLIDKNNFKDHIHFNTLISYLAEVSRNRYLYHGNLELVLRRTKNAIEQYNKPILLRTLTAYENISKLYGIDAFLSCMESGEDPKAYFSSRFEATFDFGNIDNLADKYHNTFAQFRDPLGIFVYMGSLKAIQLSDEGVIKAFKTYIISVLNNEFYNLRYNESLNPHLQTIFSAPGGQATKESWRNNRLPEPLNTSGKCSAINYRDFFIKKIMTDKHLESIQNFPRLEKYLQNNLLERSGKNSPAEMSAEEEFEHLLIGICEGTTKIEALLNKLGQKKMRTLSLGEFKNDLESLKPQKTAATNFTIEETDDSCDLLMIGTEIRGSCQRIDGNPEQNKCLVSYLLNGEIKAIVVKSARKIVARSLVRLMWDSEAQHPVILQERMYNNISGEDEIEARINEWAIEKAKQMNCPLVSVEIGTSSKPYTGKISFLGGFAPYTYSDASKGVKAGPFETANCHILYEPQDVSELQR